MLADAAEAHDAQGLALQLNALAIGLLLPLALAHGVTGDGQIPGAGEHMAHGQLCHRLGGGAGGILHVDAVGLGIVHVDVVHTHAAADDQLQLAALGRINVLLADLGLGADHGHIKPAQGLAQLIGLIELLDDFISILAQLFHCASIHPIGNQNS